MAEFNYVSQNSSNIARKNRQGLKLIEIRKYLLGNVLIHGAKRR